MEKRLREKLPGGKFKDVPAIHSRRMGAIRGRGNRTTELRFRAMLVRAGIRGWTMHHTGLHGKPDFYFPDSRIAVFIDGCFWHGCQKCGHVPSVNRPYWRAKIERNRERDRTTKKLLLASNVRTVRFWEHELRESGAECIARLTEILADS